MPLPERYYREQIARHEAAEREAVREQRREWLKVLSHLLLAVALGLTGIGFAFHTYDIERGWVYWWAGVFVWVTGVLVALFTAYLRGVRRGDWR